MSSEDTVDSTDQMEMDMPLDLQGEEVMDFLDGDEDKWEFDPASHKIRYEGIVVTTNKDKEGSRVSQIRRKKKFVLKIPFEFFWQAPWISPVPRYPSGIRRPLRPTNGVRIGPRTITTLKKNATPRSIDGPSRTRHIPEPADSIPTIQVPFAPIAEGGHRDLGDVDAHVGAVADVPTLSIIPEIARTASPPLPRFPPLQAPTFPVWRPVSGSRRAGSSSRAHVVIHVSSDEEEPEECPSIDVSSGEEDPEASPSHHD